jgi:hypothetical protein
MPNHLELVTNLAIIGFIFVNRLHLKHCSCPAPAVPFPAQVLLPRINWIVWWLTILPVCLNLLRTDHEVARGSRFQPRPARSILVVIRQRRMSARHGAAYSAIWQELARLNRHVYRYQSYQSDRKRDLRSARLWFLDQLLWIHSALERALPYRFPGAA